MRVIAVGEPFAGDDGVGPEVARRLLALRPGADVHRARDAAALLELLRTRSPVVIVDALVGSGAPLAPRLVPLSALRAEPRRSSHGLGVGEAAELVRLLYPREAPPSIELLGIPIRRPARLRASIDPALEGAVARAVALLAGRL